MRDPPLYIDSETSHRVITHKTNSGANSVRGGNPRALGRRPPNVIGRGRSADPFPDVKRQRSSRRLVSSSLGPRHRWNLRLTWTRLPHLWATSMRKPRVSRTFHSAATLQGWGPPRAHVSPRTVDVSPTDARSTPFPSKMKIVGEGYCRSSQAGGHVHTSAPERQRSAATFVFEGASG